MKNEIRIREARASDIEDLAKISRTTWDGADYLESVSAKWISEKGFYVAEKGTRVVGCGKLTLLPGEVAWLEGLRVHNDFKGRGYGRVISDNILKIAQSRLKSGEFSSIEFSTYINNSESISMAEKQGFAVSDLFHVVSIENPPVVTTSVTLEQFSPSIEDFTGYKEHTPCGWKYVLSCASGSLEWLKKNAEFWRVNTGATFLTANRGSEISPLFSAFDDPSGFVQGAFAFAEKRRLDYLEIVMHDSHKNLLSTVKENGFVYWDEDGAGNLPVYRFRKQANSPQTT